MRNFTLVGHSCPYGVYPAPVIPVGKVNGSYFAAYPGGKDGPSLRPVDLEDDFVHYSPEVCEKLSDFDYQSERLFAYAPEQVRRYKAGRERQFFESFLKESRFLATNSGIRRMLQKRVDGLRLAG